MFYGFPLFFIGAPPPGGFLPPLFVFPGFFFCLWGKFGEGDKQFFPPRETSYGPQVLPTRGPKLPLQKKEKKSGGFPPGGGGRFRNKGIPPGFWALGFPSMAARFFFFFFFFFFFVLLVIKHARRRKKPRY
eukprot:FR734657.1.p3 GENE.FR734657.1~~FR734657.1.p3  ORF type:complete len:131 (-),score=87.96 FR734657.1:877-1269(-)